MPRVEDVIAQAIGHHFWKCKTDAEARQWGMDCARKVVEAMDDAETQTGGFFVYTEWQGKAGVAWRG